MAEHKEGSGGISSESGGNVNVSASQLLEMIKTVVNSSITENITGENGALTKKSEILKHIDTRIENLGSEVMQLQIENNDLKSQLAHQNQDIQQLESENINMQGKVNESLIHANNNEQYGRKESIRIYGIPVSMNPRFENCKREVSMLLRQKLGLYVEEGDMNAAHRIGPIIEGKQAIILRFFARDTKSTVMENRYKLKGTNIRIYDDLTLPNRKLLNRLTNHKEIDQAWVSNGKIKAKTVDGYRFTAEILMDIDLKCSELRKQRRTTYNANAAPVPVPMTKSSLSRNLSHLHLTAPQ